MHPKIQMWFAVKYRGTMYNELKYRGKKILESCYKTPMFFHIRTIKQRHRIKYIYDTKNINIYFSLLRGFLSGGFCPGGICPGGFYPRLVKYIFDCHVYSLRFVRYVLNVLFVSINVKIKKYRCKKLLFIILWYLIKMNVNCLNRIKKNDITNYFQSRFQ